MLFHWFWKHFLSPPARDREFCARGVALGLHGVQEVSATFREVAMDPNADPAALRGIHVAIRTVKTMLF